MSARSKIKKIMNLVQYPELAKSKNNHIFLFSHMRSRSSLLSHIIGSNKNIYGYSELHRNYDNKLDLFRMRMELFDELKNEKSYPLYFFDKILHSKNHLDKSLYENTIPKIIMLVRKPEETLKSTIAMANIAGNECYDSIDKVSQYYNKRLRELIKISEVFNKDCYFIESDSLINDTDNILSALSSWLMLETPLKSSYKLFQNTGKAGYGDPSENINAGKIKKTKQNINISIPENIINDANIYYDECVSKIIKNCEICS